MKQLLAIITLISIYSSISQGSSSQLSYLTDSNQSSYVATNNVLVEESDKSGIYGEVMCGPLDTFISGTCLAQLENNDIIEVESSFINWNSTLTESSSGGISCRKNLINGLKVIKLTVNVNCKK